MRVSTALIGHPRVYKLRLEGFGTYALAAACSEELGFEGFVPYTEADRIGDFRVIIKADLAEPCPDGYYLNRWKPTTGRSHWHILGNSADAHPLISIRTARSVQLKRLRRQVSPALRARIIERDMRICGLCGEGVGEDSDLHIDHILPVSLGGETEFNNLQVAHAACNLKKGARV